MKKNKKKKFVKLKKFLAGFMALVLVVGLTIVGTLAWLSATTETKTNVFTATANIKLDLIEPSFKPDEANKFLPGGEYDKNPILVNSTGDDTTAADSLDSSEWVMLRVDYMESSNKIDYRNVAKSSFGQYMTFENFATGNNNDWIKVDLSKIDSTIAAKVKEADFAGSKTGTAAQCEFYVYKRALTSNGNIKNPLNSDNAYGAVMGTTAAKTTETNGCRTYPLFDKVKIKDEADLKTNYNDGNGNFDLSEMPAFKIDLAGGGVKNEGTDARIDDKNLAITTTTQNGINVLTGFSAGDDGTKSKAIIEKLVELLAEKIPSTTAS